MKKLLLLVITFFLFMTAKAQITGKIMNVEGQPVPFANIIAFSCADSIFVGGAVSGDDGVFDMITNSIGKMVLKITSIGYVPLTVSCQVPSELGDIVLENDTTMLNEVTVLGERPIYKHIDGGIRVDITNSVLSNVGTADDILPLLPYVEEKADEYTVFAKGTPLFYIDNRKITNISELKQLSSQEIKNVEVITSPGAQYDSEYRAVIRINTKKNVGEGLSMGFNSTIRRSNKWKTLDDLAVKYLHKGLEVFTSFTFENNNLSEDLKLREKLSANSQNIRINQASSSSLWFTDFSTKIGCNIDLTPNHSLGGYYKYINAIYNGGQNNSSQHFICNDSLENVDQYMFMSWPTSRSHEMNVYYSGKIAQLAIVFDGTYINKKQVRQDLSKECTQAVSQNVSNSDIVNEVSNSGDKDNSLWAGRLSLGYPIGKGNASAGCELTYSEAVEQYRSSATSILSSNDDIRETNFATFLQYEFTFGKWSAGVGVRYEHVKSKYKSFGENVPEQSPVYSKFFPNIKISWEGDKLACELSYNSYIQRPTYKQLSSYVQYDNKYTYEGGNPLLRPSYLSELSFSLSYGWVVAECGYQYEDNPILQYATSYQGQNIILWKPENFNKLQVIYMSVNVSPRFGFYSPIIEVGASRQFFGSEQYGAERRSHKPEFSIDIQNWFLIGKSFKAMASWEYVTSYDMDFIRVGKDTHVDFRVQKSLIEGNLNLVFFARDIFAQRGSRWTAYYPSVEIDRDAYQYSRQIGLQISYTFNHSKSKYKGSGAGAEERNRL